MLVGAKTALRTNRRAVRYAGESVIRANDVFVHETKTIRQSAKRTRIELGSFRGSLPQETELGHLLHDVLGLDSWADVTRLIPTQDEVEEP